MCIQPLQAHIHVTFLWDHCELGQFNLLRVLHCAFKDKSKLNSPFFIVTMEAPPGQIPFHLLCDIYQWLYLVNPFVNITTSAHPRAQSCRNSERTLPLFLFTPEYKFLLSPLRLRTQRSHLDKGTALLKRGLRHSVRWPQIFILD